MMVICTLFALSRNLLNHVNVNVEHNEPGRSCIESELRLEWLSKILLQWLFLMRSKNGVCLSKVEDRKE